MVRLLKEGIEISFENVKSKKCLQYFPNSVADFIVSMESIIKV